MTSTRGAGAVRTVFLLCRLAARRLWNRASVPFARRRKKSEVGSSKRRATPSKNRVSALLIVAFGAFLLQSGLLAGNVLDKLILITSTPESAPPGDATTTVSNRSGSALPEATQAKRTARQRAPLTRYLPFAPRTLPETDRHDDYRRGLGLFLTLLFVGVLCLGLSGSNRDLGQVEWSLEWLFTLPVAGSSLFLAKLGEYTLTNPFCWVTCLPFFAMIYGTAGYGLYSILLAVAATTFVALLVAAFRLVAETMLRRVFALGGLKNVQAAGTVLGILFFYTVLYLGIGKQIPVWFASLVHTTPGAVEWMPWNLPLAFATPGTNGALMTVYMLGIVIVAGWGAVATCSYLVRNGFIAVTGTYQGRRGRTQDWGKRPGLFSGILAKEIRMLLRDRNLFVQLFVVPLLVIGFQVMLWPQMIEGAAQNHRHAAMFAFGIGAYVLMAGAFSILTVEGRALWLLSTFPRRLSDILIEKATLWATISAFYVIAILAWFAGRSHEERGVFAVSALMALGGILIYAFIASALGILGGDPLSTEPRKRIKPAYVYLYMLLASMYSYGIYTDDWWQKIVLVILCALLAYAVWQKVRDQIPYLLDPTASPPPSISTSDGLILGLMFFVVQGFYFAIFVAYADRRGNPSQMLGWDQIMIAFVTAGLVTAAASLATFLRRKVPDLGVCLGLRRARGADASFLRVLAIAAASGAAAVVCLVAYYFVLRNVPYFREILESHRVSVMPIGRVADVSWFVLVCVVAAPIFEEYIFRAVLFRGLRRTLPFSLAALASAAIFAICHPPLSAIPVFGVGLAAAYCFERTGLLVGPILVHTIYNASVLFLSTLDT